MIEITGLSSATGPLTKRISLSDTGALISDGSACVMGRGHARRVHLASMTEFADTIRRLDPNQAIALGALRPDLPDAVDVTTQIKLSALNGSAPAGLIARTAEHIAYRPGRAALALIDVDTKGMPPAVIERIRGQGGYWSALVSVLPALAEVTRAVRTSTSSGLSRTDTGEPVKGSNGVHVFLLVQDGADVERFLRDLHDRCWLNGLGWLMVGAGGQMLERSLIDRTVYAPERLVFEAPPILKEPLAQDAERRAPSVIQGEAADTRSICRPLTVVEQAKLRDLKAAERHRLAGPADQARGVFIEAQAARIVKRTGCSPAAAHRTVSRQCQGVLLPDVVLPFDVADHEGATVADVLANPAKFVGATLSDPLEGVEYGRGKAKVMRRSDGTLWINSFAHGRTVYELRYDAASVEAALNIGGPIEAADRFVNLVLAADLEPDEEQRLRDLTCKLSGVQARPLGAKVKAARASQQKQHAKAEVERRAASRTDRRLQIPVPLPDAERVPVLRTLDEVLGAAEQVEPPMRDLDGHPVEVRTRPPMMLHELTSEGSNQAEPAKTRLPPPSLPLLTRHDRYSLAHEIEQHIEFTAETEAGGSRSVALPPTFVDHFIAYRDSALPRVGAIVTAPLVMPDGKLLAPPGLDRERKLVFRIEPRLMDLLPSPDRCSAQATARALDFLVSEWLCDVAADFSGKCILIALALTILERVLLPERPAFFITAGKRGGGKTTAIMMVILAVTGKKPPAAAWSPNEEERRKAVLAYLAEGLAALVWDNIPLGTTISCPTLEKVLTAESYSDRVLGQSANITVPAFTVMAFTGNNISPKGDLASRSLVARLEVNRPDPENRKFTHADPVAWTLEHRGRILSALYTILLGNAQLKPDQRREAKTRFKGWWHLVGSAVENAAAALVRDQFPIADEDRYATALDFGKLFTEVEEGDEEGTLLADVLDVLHHVWPARSFLASDVADLVNFPKDGEAAHSIILKGFFEASGRGNAATFTPKSVGRRLTSSLGAPVLVGDQIMTLAKVSSEKESQQKRASWFQVRVA